MKNQKLITRLLAATVITTMLGGCGSKPTANTTANESAKSETSKAVELTWYNIGTPQADTQVVQDKMNEILKKTLNTTIKITTFDWGSYDQKMNMKIASGEDFDLCYTANWACNFNSSASKGAFVPMDDLLAKYGKDITTQVPKKYLDGGIINGKMFGIISYQIMAGGTAFAYNKELVDKYNFDISKVKTLSDVTPFLESVKKNEPDKIPYQANVLDAGDIMKGYDNFTSVPSFPAQVAFNDSNVKVVNIYDQPQAMEYYKLQQDWYKKGYIKKDAASVKDYKAETGTKKYAMFGTVNKPGVATDQTSQFGYDIVTNQVGEEYITSSSLTSSLVAISKTSKNPDRAMMFINEMFKNKELYNMWCFGIKGTHYNVAENVVTPIANSAYNPNTDWEIGNQFNALIRKGAPADVWDQTKKLNDSAILSPLIGFTYDNTNVKSENAQISAVLSEYMAVLGSGMSDPETTLPELNTKLKKAGLEKVIADAQKQIDTWKAANK